MKQLDNSGSTEPSSAIAELRERVAILERDLKTSQGDRESQAETLKVAQQALQRAERAENAVSDIDKRTQRTVEVEPVEPPPAPVVPETPVPQAPEPVPVPARRRTFFQKLF